jgi:hypothetical protein
LFAGLVTAASTATVTTTWSGTAPTTIRTAGQEFTSSTGTWSIDGSIAVLDTTAGTATWPTMTPATSGELYFGYGIPTAANTAGSTAGFTYIIDASNNSMAYDLAASGVTAPIWGSAVERFAVTVLMVATSGPSVVQTAQADSGGATSVTVNLTNPTTAGNCLVVATTTTNATTNATVSSVELGGVADNFGSLFVNGTGATAAVQSFWADPSCAGGQTAVLVSTTGGVGAAVLTASVLEVAGLPSTLGALLDLTAANSSLTNSTSWSSGATGTTTEASELWVGAGYAGAGTTITPPGSPWHNLTAQNSAPITVTGYQVTTSTGAAAYAGTTNVTGHWAAAVITLKSSPLGAGNFTGLIMAPGTWNGQPCQIYDTSAGGSLTFAASSISNVADGTADVISPLSGAGYVWSSADALWYPL